MSTQFAPQILADPPTVPRSVRNASTLWFAAVGAGAFEAGLAVAGMLADGSASLADVVPRMGFRLMVFAVASSWRCTCTCTCAWAAAGPVSPSR
ncbi:hypothetical protein [Streptosporangium sp. NPDC048865]|uniref:hypothetical protein n=1 Tax=Streptosporangium sp. NPDC048865 TaxID=3155766 RepID=UPI003424AF55